MSCTSGIDCGSGTEQPSPYKRNPHSDKQALMFELPANLTPREADVIALYSQGITKAREIAKELSISNTRVTQLLNKAFKKMGHENARRLRVDAYVKAVRLWRTSPDRAAPEGFDAILPSEYSAMPEDIWDYFLDSPTRRQYFASLEEAHFAALPMRARVSLRNLRERLTTSNSACRTGSFPGWRQP